MRFIFFMILAFGISGDVLAQDGQPILLQNPSFEDKPAAGKPPKGWYDCGFPGESPPDVQPADNLSLNPFFEVTQTAQDGDTYLGLVFRDNDTWEMVSQRLSTPLEAGKCYEFSIYLCKSAVYKSLSRKTNEEELYTTPGKFKIWGGSGYCNKLELLDQTPVIKNTRWIQYNFQFKPTKNISHLVFEAHYNTPVLFPTNGNLLVDNASPIFPVPCDDDEPITEPVVIEPVPIEPEPTPDPVVVAPEPTRPAAKLEGLNKYELRVGQTIRIDKLYFTADSYEITPKSFQALDDLYNFLRENQNVKLEIGGHTNNTPSTEYCDRLSTNRAKSVAEYLVAKGVSVKQLEYKGYGKRVPVVSNKTADGRKRNQRVEVKILELG